MSNKNQVIFEVVLCVDDVLAEGSGLSKRKATKVLSRLSESQPQFLDYIQEIISDFIKNAIDEVNENN